ncbi:MAG: gamma-glutamyltransferase family protein [Maricaulis sp.]|nr:gamma-glutamyltransferase family protein [Maricaulis sp.]
MIRRLFSATALATSLLLVACGNAENSSSDTLAVDAPQTPARSDIAAPSPVPASPAMVAAANPHAVEAGLAALRAGGDAIDAAVAIQSVLGLVEPQSSGLGGGAFLMYFDAESETLTAYDGRETAPASAGPDLFVENGQTLGFGAAIFSGHSIGVPGAVAMLAMAHEDHGQLPWADGFDAAIGLASDGFAVSPRLQSFIVQMQERGSPLDVWPASRDYFYLEDGSPLPVGYLLQNQAYADSARAIAENWRNLYEGPLAAAIIDAVQDAPRPGGLTLSDLASYEPIRREALCRPYRVWRVCGSPPPASGGITVNEILGLLEPYDMTSTGPDSVEGWRRFIEASRLAYADRDAYVADADHVSVPVEGLLDPNYIQARSALINRDDAMVHATPGTPPGISQPGADATPDSPGTSHFVVVDAAGNIVSMTTTVESVFGSHRMAGGFFLNNQLTDFSRTPRDANDALVPNAPAGGKRPRSSMSPTIIFDADGDFVMATGSPGGSSIIGYTAKTIVGVLDWGLTPQDAINLPNVVARGDTVRLEAGMDQDILDGLTQLGFTLDANRGEISGIHIIQRLEDGSLIGGADPRREGIVGEP